MLGYMLVHSGVRDDVCVGRVIHEGQESNWMYLIPSTCLLKNKSS